MKTHIYNFPTPLKGISAIRIEQSEQSGKYHVDKLDNLGRVMGKDDNGFRDRKHAVQYAQSLFRTLIDPRF